MHDGPDVGLTGSVEEMAPTYSVPMPPNQDASFNEFVRSLDANGLDAASLGHVGIMDEVASPGNFMTAPGQPELQVRWAASSHSAAAPDKWHS